MPEVPHNWSLGLRRPLVALLGAVAVEEQQEDRANPRHQRTYGSVFAELQAVWNQWNGTGIVEWNTGISFNCIFVSLGYFPALQIFLKDVVRISNSITHFPYDFVHDINL